MLSYACDNGIGVFIHLPRFAWFLSIMYSLRENTTTGTLCPLEAGKGSVILITKENVR